MTATNAARIIPPPGPEGAHPVFEGLALAGLAGKEIAQLSEVSPPTVSKWRRGRARAPLGRVIFLTMLLAHMADELQETYDGWGQAPKAWHLHMQSRIDGVLKALREQESINTGAPAGALRQGTRLYREWFRRDERADEAALAARRVALGLDTTDYAF